MSTVSQVRVRFAPSPTGFLHIGGVRAALYNWLYAKRYGGQFLLRIEDTDLERSEQRFTDDILASLKWLGLQWDEEIVYQSKRLDIHAERAEELVRQGHAYRCYCTEEEVEKMRAKAQAEGKKPMYDRTCRNRKDVPVGKKSVIRAKLPLEGGIEFHDMIRGDIRFENADLDDFVIVRSSGAPTYNLSVVVDDMDMRMTHIVRGDDHINNTPKQLHLYQFFKYPLPQFAHLPMIMGADKKKLSKRHGDVSANDYRAQGYLPEALLNFLVRLGWSHGDQEVFTVEEMCRLFDFDHVQKSAAVFNLEKLQWMNGTYIRQVSADRLAAIVAEDFSSNFPGDLLNRLQSPLGTRLVSLVQPKVKTLKEMTEQLIPLCTPGVLNPDLSGLKWQKDDNLKIVTKNAIRHLLEQLNQKIAGSRLNKSTLEEMGMSAQDVDAFLRQAGEEHGVKLGDLTQPLRLALTGTLVSASLFDLIAILPWSLVEARLKTIADW